MSLNLRKRKVVEYIEPLDKPAAKRCLVTALDDSYNFSNGCSIMPAGAGKFDRFTSAPPFIIEKPLDPSNPVDAAKARKQIKDRGWAQELPESRGFLEEKVCR